MHIWMMRRSRSAARAPSRCAARFRIWLKVWERSMPLLDDPPPVKVYPPGTWGPNAIHQLIAPNAWRLPFERAWREKK